MDRNEFFLQAYANKQFIINFETGEVYSPRLNRNLGCVHKNTGYVYIEISQNGERHIIGQHQLVWLCFYGKLDADLVINHKNGIKIDNALQNLEEITQQENVLHAYRTNSTIREKNRQARLQYYKTHKSVRRKLTQEQVDDIRKLYSTGNYTHKLLGKQFGVSPNTIGNIVNKVCYKS